MVKEEIVKTPIVSIFDQIQKKTLGFRQQMNQLGVSLNARSDVPGFHYLLRNSPDMMEYIFDNQLWRGSAVSNGVFHTYQHPGAKVERGFEEVLQEAVKQYDSWTF